MGSASFNKSADLQHKFHVRKGDWSSRMAFSGGKILVLRRYVVNVYKETGGKDCSHMQQISHLPRMDAS